MTIKAKRIFVSAIIATYATAAMAMTTSTNTSNFNFILQADENYYNSPVLKPTTTQKTTVAAESENFNTIDRLYKQQTVP